MHAMNTGPPRYSRSGPPGHSWVQKWCNLRVSMCTSRVRVSTYGQIRISIGTQILGWYGRHCKGNSPWNCACAANNVLTVSEECIVYMHELASGTPAQDRDTTKFQKRLIDWLSCTSAYQEVKVVQREKFVGRKRSGNFPGDGPSPWLPKGCLATRHATSFARRWYYP